MGTVKYEYRFCIVGADNTKECTQVVEKQLNELGREGWRLKGKVERGWSNAYYFTMERELEPSYREPG